MKPSHISEQNPILPETPAETTIPASRRNWRKRFFRHIPPVLIVVVIIFALFVTGFVYFGERINHFTIATPLPQADGIIVLTGGRARIENAIALLKKNKAQQLLISGVDRSADSATLARANHADPKLFECCIELGHDALNTKGNGEESAQWVQKHHFKKIYIVTNDYHMPRSLYIMQQAMPHVELIPFPIRIKNKNNDWLNVINHLRVLGVEYVKYIGTKFLKL